VPHQFRFEIEHVDRSIGAKILGHCLVDAYDFRDAQAKAHAWIRKNYADELVGVGISIFPNYLGVEGEIKSIGQEEVKMVPA
jgi:hypothetical protein